MINHENINLFKRYSNASEYAFGGKGKEPIVSHEDKELYWDIYEELIFACTTAVDNQGLSNKFYVKPRPYSRDRGARGHRPKDLWCAIRNKDSGAFNEMPQIYVIVSERGIEVGFAVSIPESDYHDQTAKIQNREIIPQIHLKLPVEGRVIEQLDSVVTTSPHWHVNKQTRLVSGDDGFDLYDTSSELFSALKSQKTCYGGGAICRIITPQMIAQSPIDLIQLLDETLKNFSNIQMNCQPKEPDRIMASISKTIQSYSEDFDYLPSNGEDGRTKKLQALAIRQGQASFRRSLMGAYEGCCTITDCDVPYVLQAAHIIPYNGPKTNHPSNGLLLRSDIHNLFDLFLLSINPSERTVRVSSRIQSPEYVALDGKKIRTPKRSNSTPSNTALKWHFDQFIE